MAGEPDLYFGAVPKQPKPMGIPGLMDHYDEHYDEVGIVWSVIAVRNKKGWHNITIAFTPCDGNPSSMEQVARLEAVREYNKSYPNDTIIEMNVLFTRYNKETETDPAKE